MTPTTNLHPAQFYSTPSEQNRSEHSVAHPSSSRYRVLLNNHAAELQHLESCHPSGPASSCSMSYSYGSHSSTSFYSYTDELSQDGLPVPPLMSRYGPAVRFPMYCQRETDPVHIDAYLSEPHHQKRKRSVPEPTTAEVPIYFSSFTNNRYSTRQSTPEVPRLYERSFSQPPSSSSWKDRPRREKVGSQNLQRKKSYSDLRHAFLNDTPHAFDGAQLR